MNLSKNLHWFIWGLFVLSCARQSSPTGGPKDTIPPTLVRAIPANETTNFKDQQIELEFSEMIITNNPKEQLIITPTVGKDFELKVKKNSIAIELDKPLQENTTYTFNFRESVQDITEKNPARNLQLAFSTGDYVDSLSISGNIYDLIKNNPAKEITVAIHPSNDTFNVLKHPAQYFTKSTDKGQFIIDHLKPAVYYIYAFDDKNRNLIVDTKNESYGFLADSINLSKDTVKIDIGIQKLDARPLKLTSARPYNTYFNIRLSKNLKNVTLSSKGNIDLFYSYGDDQSNVRIYNSFENLDSLAVNLVGTDSVGNKLDSTLYAKFQTTREVTPEKFDVSLKSSSIIGSKGLLKAAITFTKPLKEINFDSLYFQVDSLTKINITQEDIKYDEPTRLLSINKRLDKSFFEVPDPEESQKPEKDTATTKLKKLNTLYAGQATFISVESDSSKTISQAIKPLNAADLSQIEFELKINHTNIIAQLLDKDFKVIQEIAGKRKGAFQDLPAGDYQFRVILDLNNNGVWDAGNIVNKEEPEKLIYSKDETNSQIIRLKANWEIVLPVLLITP
jgi:uncharacterized protein (DUF2141 family)